MIGTTLQNRYRLDAEIGRGGMGVVYRAHDVLLDRDVAVKVLGAAGLGSEGRARLLREARAAARLNHTNIVSVYDAGEADSVSFIVTELVDGESLHVRRPTDLGEIVAIARQVCAALDHAHAHGIVHRDLKPENVLITPGGTAKLMDFGLARSGASRQSSEGAVVGTVFYLAPEQALGREIDGRADLYALGVMLYELATGRLPFAGDDVLTVISQHLHAPITPPRTIKPDLPSALDELIVQLLGKRPEERPASAREVQRLLDMVSDIGRTDTASSLATIGARQATPRVPNNLPVQLTTFIGREKEIEAIKTLLTPHPGQEGGEGLGRGARLLTLTGSGGTGKTRLALHVAADVLASFADGVWLIELAALSDPELVPQTLAAVLGVREEPNYPLVKTLSDYLRTKTALIILDNCEHLIDACARLADALLRACLGVKIVATSREALGVPGETAYRVPSLTLPDPRRRLSSTELMNYESIRLFVDRAAAVRPDFALTESNTVPLAQICQRLDGVPLAIELAAARVRSMTVEQIADRLDDRFRLLTGGSRTALPRQQTLRALIDWSWDLLSDSERAVLRRLSVFLSGWTLEAAEAVVSSDEIDERAVLELLTRLIEKSLVMLEEQGAETRYSLLETIRQYARDKLWESGEAKAVRDRHTRYFAGLSILAEPNLRRADQLTWLARLEREHDNLRAALKWSLGQEDEETALYLAGNLSRFWYLRGYWNEGRDWLRQALALAPVTPDTSESLVRARVMALCGAGWLADDDGSEVPLYTESLELSRRIGDRWHEAFSLRGMVAGISNWGNPEHVWPRLQESQALFEELQDQWGLALVRYNLGWMEFNRDNGKQAEAMWAQAHEWFRQSGDRWGIAVAISALGYTARLRGDYSRAVALNKESLALFRELGDKAGIAVSLVRLGNVALRRGEYTEAIALLEESIALQRERGDQSGLVSSLYLLGMVFTYQGDYARALATMEASLALARQLNDEYLIPYALTYLASTVYYAGDVQRAATLWQESLDRQAEEGERDVIGHSLLGLGLVAVHQGDLALAGQRLEKSLSVMKAVGDRRAIAIALHSLGRLALAQGDAARARQVFKESLVLRKKTGARRGIAETLESIAGAVEHPDRAARLFGSAAALREVIGAPVPLVERDDYDRRVAAARAQMGESAFAGAWAEGRAMTLEDAIALALSDEW